MKAHTICCYCVSKRMTKGALQNHCMQLYGQTNCVSGGVYITTFENMPTPLFEEPLTFIAHGHIFKRLLYIQLPGLEGQYTSDNSFMKGCCYLKGSIKMSNVDDQSHHLLEGKAITYILSCKNNIALAFSCGLQQTGMLPCTIYALCSSDGLNTYSKLTIEKGVATQVSDPQPFLKIIKVLSNSMSTFHILNCVRINYIQNVYCTYGSSQRTQCHHSSCGSSNTSHHSSSLSQSYSCLQCSTHYSQLLHSPWPGVWESVLAWLG